MGNPSVNKSIGASWQQSTRVEGLDDMVDKAISAGHGNAKLNVRLEISIRK